MKVSFNSLDIACAVYELQGLVGMRVNQIYDLDPKTYIFKLHRNEEKAVLLLESGTRFHSTTFDWPKNSSPSGFTMKLRKHLRNKRLEGIHQLGKDRIVDFKFGSGEATYHVILELFNRGNILLLDHMLVILSVLRPHTEGDKKFAVKEAYPVNRVRETSEPPSIQKLTDIFNNAKQGEKISKILLPHLDYGLALIEHLIMVAGLPKNLKYSGSLDQSIIDVLAEQLWIGEEIMNQVSNEPSKGYIISKAEKRHGQEDLLTYQEFHPYLFFQHAIEHYTKFPSFNDAVDEFFSKTEGQKIELRALQMEKEALLKVEKIKEDQRQRVDTLIYNQENNRRKGELILENSALVDEVIDMVRRAISIQMPWPDINTFVADLARHNHPIGRVIYALKLEMNQITLYLRHPYSEWTYTPGHDGSMLVDIDLGLSAFANASRYYLNKKSAEQKEKKTMEAQDKAIKSAEKRAKQTLKDIHTMTTITKARKTFWFEKFYWFISSDNYLVIGGRDQQQNELIVKRYMKKGDLYVHADLHGASSIVIKNPSDKPVPPRTLNEAGNMAVSYSIGWEAKVMCSAWWVHYHQVSKTAPSGEYLTPGSFMIRGLKNYLLPAQLAMGFSFLFKVEESSVFRHKDERKAKAVEESTRKEPQFSQDLSGEDVMVVELEMGARGVELLASCYLPLDSLEPPPSQELRSLVEYAESKKVELLLGCDANAHHKVWGSKDSNERDDGDDQDLAVSDGGTDNSNGKNDEDKEINLVIDEDEATNLVNDENKEINLVNDEDQDKLIAIDNDQNPVLVDDEELNRNLEEHEDRNPFLVDDEGLNRTLEKDEDPNPNLVDDEEIKVVIPKGFPFGDDFKGFSGSFAKDMAYLKKLMSEITIPKGASTEDRNPCRHPSGTQSQTNAGSSGSMQLKTIHPHKEKQTSGKKEKVEKEKVTLKRGQRSKLKKIKEKYKDQDEEEKQLRMSILQSAGTKKEIKKDKKAVAKPTATSTVDKQSSAAFTKLIKSTNKEKSSKLSVEPSAEEDNPASDSESSGDELDCLTGQPHTEDELLFAIPVIAPYTALTNYKYKVKLIPGTGKRGKASRTAVDYFTKMKECTPQEKALLKNVNDQLLSRNFPGKVKVSVGPTKK